MHRSHFSPQARPIKGNQGLLRRPCGKSRDAINCLKCYPVIFLRVEVVMFKLAIHFFYSHDFCGAVSLAGSKVATPSPFTL